MKNYYIRFANHGDISDIMSFINKYWKAGHILGTRRSFFEYEHLIDDRLNYALALDCDSNEILCLCGFLQSCKELSKGSVWDVIWKKKPEAPRGIGLEVIDYIRLNCGTPRDFFVGLNAGTIPIHLGRGYLVDTLRHYYRLNMHKENYYVANITQRHIPSYSTSIPIRLIQISEGGDPLQNIIEKTDQQQPYKDYWYVCKRFVNHPIYKYDLWALKHINGCTNSLLITRTVHSKLGNVLRIVDFIGLHSEMGYIGSEIDRIIFERDCEYADIYCYGVKEDYLFQMGFKLKIKEDNNVIPNYFEPFIQQNIDIFFASPLKNGFYIFKGDADQDRPNIL